MRVSAYQFVLSRSLDENLAAIAGPAFDTEELEQIDALTDGVDLSPSGPIWADPSDS